MSILTHTISAALIFLGGFNATLLAADQQEVDATLTAPASPPVESHEPQEITLETILKSTLSRNGQIHESEQDVEIARAQLSQAIAAAFPHAEAIVLGAPIPAMRGNPTASTTNWKEWGGFFTGGIQVIQPLYTFGQIGGYQRAANAQIDAREGQVDMKKADMVATAKEFYYGYLMATDLDRLVGDLSDYLTEAVKTAEDSMKSKKKSNVKPHDLYKLKTALEDLRQKKLMAVQGRQTAERAIAWVSGMTFQKLPSHRIAPEEFQKRSLDEYLKLAHAHRPEFRALKSGQAARLALADAKQAQSYPVLFLGGFFSQSLCSVCDSQPSIFANDPFNRTVGGGGIGLKFDLEFWRHSAEAAEQRAEAMKLKMTESYAVPGIDLQVKRAFWEVEQQQQGLEIAERRKATARKWFVSNAMGWSIGLTPPKELLEALEGDGLSKKNYIETVYALNMALAHLTQAVGVEVTGLKYR